jgi:hypothetical protein
MSKSLFLLSVFFVLLESLSLWLYPTWGLMLGVWFGLVFFIIYKKLVLPLPRWQQLVFLLNASLYPLLETCIKIMINENVIPYSWFWLNRLEHGLFSFCLTILVLPLFWKEHQSFSVWKQGCMVVGIVIIIGNLNEFLEYLVRIVSGLTTSDRFAVYYWDTIYDLMLNLMGSVIAFGLYLWATHSRKSFISRDHSNLR